MNEKYFSLEMRDHLALAEEQAFLDCWFSEITQARLLKALDSI